MKVLKVLLATLIAGAIVFLSLSCSSGASSTSTVKTQVATVQKGSISVSVTGTGNLALENKQELSFGQTGQANNATTSKISEVDVAAGQIVEKGQVLVKADTKDWQDQITSDQHNLDTAKAGLDSAKAGLDSASAAVDQAKSNVIQSQNSLQTAQYALSMQTDIKDIQDKIDNANIQLQQAKLMLRQATAQSDSGSMSYWQQMITYYSVSPTYKDKTGAQMADGGLLGQLEKQMADLLADPAHSGAAVTTSVADINSKQLAVQQAQANLINAQNSVITAQNGITTAQNNITLAQNKVADAQSTLDDDKASPQEIDAPFKGLITKLWTNSNGNTLSPGDIVARDTALVEIAESDKFVANILVTEKDVMSVKMGGDATVSFDALSGLNFPAKITQIAPLSTTSQGVVNYKVTVEITSLTPTSTSTTAAQKSPQSTTGATPPTNFPSGGVMPTNLPAGISPPSASNTAGTTTQTATQNISLKDGLSATVTITVQQKDNILIVPNKAIKSSTVQVISGTTTETRSIKTGITDSTNTEVTDGLKQGEQVLITSSTSTSSGSSKSGGAGIGIGGPPGGF